MTLKVFLTTSLSSLFITCPSVSFALSYQVSYISNLFACLTNGSHLSLLECQGRGAEGWQHYHVEYSLVKKFLLFIIFFSSRLTYISFNLILRKTFILITDHRNILYVWFRFHAWLIGIRTMNDTATPGRYSLTDASRTFVILASQ